MCICGWEAGGRRGEGGRVEGWRELKLPFAYSLSSLGASFPLPEHYPDSLETPVLLPLPPPVSLQGREQAGGRRGGWGKGGDLQETRVECVCVRGEGGRGSRATLVSYLFYLQPAPHTAFTGFL